VVQSSGGASLGGSGATGTPSATSIASTYPAWETALIQGLGGQPNAANLYFLNLWQQSEGSGAVAGNNPLAITDPKNQFPHSGIIAENNGDPVYAFPSLPIGIQATVTFLQENGYQNVISALKGSDFSAMWAAVNQSGWCQGCQNGQYPVAAYAKLNGQIPTTGPGSDGSSSASLTAATTTGGVTCGEKGGGASILGLHIGTACQLKALTGGLFVGLGASVIIVGVFVLARQTSIGKNLTNTAASALGPVGKAYTAASGVIESRRFARAEVAGQQNAAFAAREYERRGRTVPATSRAPRNVPGLDFD
jgi:hypothetical protein